MSAVGVAVDIVISVGVHFAIHFVAHFAVHFVVFGAGMEIPTICGRTPNARCSVPMFDRFS